MSKLTIEEIQSKKQDLEQNIKILIHNFYADVKYNFDIELNITNEEILGGESKFLYCNPKVKVIL